MAAYLIYLILLVPVSTAAKPNILVLLADDLGIGDVGCFGNTSLRTPNIDRLAEEGVMLTHHLTASSVCTPSRAALLTGRYPIRSGMETSNILPIIPVIAGSTGLPQEEVTFAKMAQSAGYNTGLIGKWHLGLSCNWYTDFCHHPLNHGFDYFYGLPLTLLKDYGNDDVSVVTSKYPNTVRNLIITAVVGALSTYILFQFKILGKCLSVFLTILWILIPVILFIFLKNLKAVNGVIMRNYDLVEQPIRLDTLTRRFVVEGREFIERSQAEQKPFLLFMSWTHVHTYLDPGPRFRGRSQHGIYGDSVEELDWGIGQILDILDERGLTNNTLVYFTSDNGGHLEERGVQGNVEGGYNKFYKGGKTHGAVDGGIRVPSLLRWPGHIPAASLIHEPTSLMDFLPTVADVIDTPAPTDRVIDGLSLLPLVTGATDISPHKFMFHYCGGNIHAVRYRPRLGYSVYKLVFWVPDYIPGEDTCFFVCSFQWSVKLDTPRLYNIITDPGETTPLNPDTPQNKVIIERMTVALHAHEASLTDLPYQFSPFQLMWRPWLQPCCNFPYCHCVDEKYLNMTD